MPLVRICPGGAQQWASLPGTEFQILGRIGKVREVGQTTRVSICANYAFKDRNGETKDKPYWNGAPRRREKEI